MRPTVVSMLAVAAGAAPSDECAFRKLTYEYALAQRSDRAPLLDVFDALELANKCQEARPAPRAHAWPKFETPTSPNLWFVAISGSDEGDGSLAHPFKTVSRALAASRAISANRTILLRQGVHYLSETISLGHGDSGLTIQNYNGEEAWLSGGLPIETTWRRWQPPVPPSPPGTTCQDTCAAHGHCCVGTISSYQHPSCAMGCLIARAGATDVNECEMVCRASDGKCSATYRNESFNLCESCPAGCDASDGVSECLDGCRIAFDVGANIWVATLAPVAHGGYHRWGSHASPCADGSFASPCADCLASVCGLHVHVVSMLTMLWVVWSQARKGRGPPTLSWVEPSYPLPRGPRMRA